MDETLKGRRLMIVGLTLFSMFFGAGNLIFPPFLAAQAGTAAWLAMAGFLISAVGLPVLGVIAVSRSGGLDCLAGRVHPAFSMIFSILIYLSIGPCLAIPRTASTSFEMTVIPFLKSGEQTALWQLVYSAVFFLLASVTAFHPEKLTQRLGKILCPALLGLIFIMFAGSMAADPKALAMPSEAYSGLAPIRGFLEGYQTMDTIAALNFGIIIALNIKAVGVKNEAAAVKSTVRSGLIAGVLLASVYCALTYVGIKAGPEAQALDNGARVLTFVADRIFGTAGTVVLGLMFFIACFNTCVGLLSCCSEFFCQLIPHISYRKWVLLFAAVSMAVSNAGLTKILAFSVPVLNGIYPVAITLIFLSFAGKESRAMYRLSVTLTGVVSVVYALEGAGISISAVSGLFALLPGYELGLGWILPGLAGALAGKGLDVWSGLHSGD